MRGTEVEAGETSRTRDAERSRMSILRAGEQLFAQHGYDGVSLGEIASVAGLSRGTPSYFFGSKEALYGAVLERAFVEREAAVASACAPVLRWSEEDGDSKALRGALAQMVGEYLDFLVGHPDFVRLMVRESLQGGERLHEIQHESRAMADMFKGVQGSVRRRGLSGFDVDDAVLLLLGLTFAPVANRETYVARMKIDLDRSSERSRLVKLAVRQLIALILRGRPATAK